MDDVLIAWGGTARAANPAQALRVAGERSAFADLFDSQVHFAAFAGRASELAPVAGRLQAALSPEQAKVLAATTSLVPAGPEHASNRFSSAAAGIAPDSNSVRTATAAVVPAAVPDFSARAETVWSPASRLAPNPAHCQWSRTAFAACLRDGELNLSVRDADLQAGQEVVESLKQALREMGISLGGIRINGIKAGA
jgi:hypothetical protein